MIAIYVSPIMVHHLSTMPLGSSYCFMRSHDLHQLLTHKDPHIFPRFEDHRRYAIVVATTSVLLILYGI